MTSTEKLVERLRQDVKAHELTGNGEMKRVQAMRDAADALEAQDARIADLGALIALAHPVMRATGWHLALASDAQGDGVLEAACVEIEEKFATALQTTGASK